MKRSAIFFLLLVLGCLFLVAVFLITACASVIPKPDQTIPASASQNFVVYDALLYKNKPDLAQHGLSPIRVIYEDEFWNKSEDHRKPNNAKIIEVAEKLNGKSVVCIDIEGWPLSGKADDITESINKYRTVASLIKKHNPAVKVGFYGCPPVRDYWRAVGSQGQTKKEAWRQENNALRPMGDFVDVVFPSLYTFYPDQEGWVKYAIENLKEARKYGKPVYAFLWPQYHDSNKELVGHYIPVEFWRLQLKTCLHYADGIVIWGGWNMIDNRPDEWDENFFWWVEAKKFLEEIQKRQ